MVGLGALFVMFIATGFMANLIHDGLIPAFLFVFLGPLVAFRAGKAYQENYEAKAERQKSQLPSACAGQDPAVELIAFGSRENTFSITSREYALRFMAANQDVLVDVTREEREALEAFTAEATAAKPS